MAGLPITTAIPETTHTSSQKDPIRRGKWLQNYKLQITIWGVDIERVDRFGYYNI